MADGRLIGLMLVVLALGGLGYRTLVVERHADPSVAAAKRYSIAVTTEPQLRVVERNQSSAAASDATERLLVCRKVMRLGGVELGTACRPRPSQQFADGAQ